MYPLLLIAFLPQVSAFVDCKIACLRCKENKEHPLVLEVHCAMCNECKQRKKERSMSPKTSESVIDTTKRAVYREGSKESSKEHHHDHSHGHSHGHSHEHSQSHENRHRVKGRHSAEDSDECPTPPPCESSEEAVPLKMTVTTTTTTTTTEATTTKKQCPPVLTCRRKKRRKCARYPCMPYMPMCMPMCMPPCPNPMGCTNTPATAPPSTAKTTDYVYVYVGVPKNMMN